MTLRDIEIILKGGRGSGDFGHTGRAGKRGGSGGGGGKGKPRRGRRSREALDKEIEAQKKPKKSDTEKDDAKSFLASVGWSNDDIDSAMDDISPDVILASKSYGNFSHGGLSVNISIDPGDQILGEKENAVTVFGEILDGSGKYKGSFTRIISKSLSGELTSDHYNFELDKFEQGKGFGSKFYQHSENELIKNGVSKVTLQANLSVGGYAWARMGFSFDEKTNFDRFDTHVLSKWNDHYGRVDNMPFTDEMTSWEIASLKGPDGHHIGKDMLLGSNWFGTKDLTEGSESRKIGDAYYASKNK